MTAEQRACVTAAFLALLDAAKAVVRTEACSVPQSRCLMQTLDTAIYNVEILCMEIDRDIAKEPV